MKKMLARFLVALCLAAGASVVTAPAQAETLRCNG